MGGSVMWIVLGSLIGVVAIFLVITTILDKKKRKKIKEMQIQNKVEVEEAKIEIIYFILEILKQNKNSLKNFVPSIGKIKMSDIRNRAKMALKKLTDSKEYKLIEEEKDYQEMTEVIKKLKLLNSNVWEKSTEVVWLSKEAKKIENSKLTNEYKNIVKEELGKIYKNEYTK